jgi:hypothetical protein
MPTQELSPEILNAAIDGFEARKKRIETQIGQIRQMLDGGGLTTPVGTPEVPTGKRRKLSAAGRAAIIAALKKRWAAKKASVKTAAAKPEPSKPKRRISEEGMKRIIAATKKRWRLAKAAKAQPAAAKNTAPARKKAAVKTAAVKALASKAAKKSAPVKKTILKKATAKKTAPASA